MPLEHLVHGELDGGVGDEEQGGPGAVPESPQSLLPTDPCQAVQEALVPGAGGHREGQENFVDTCPLNILILKNVKFRILGKFCS